MLRRQSEMERIMHTELTATNCFHRFACRLSALSNLLTLTILLWMVSVTSSMPNSAGEMILTSVTSILRAIASLFRSIPALA
jgi:hypothetical protein